ncbi:MAG: endolytic transglycosylase MltG [Chloroflexi bacterium]|nr:endolytic transglycosylase MltG [Chloroflexota bacterium]
MKRSRPTVVFLLLIIALACLAVFYLAGIPQRAAEIFGPPDSHLDLTEKLYRSAMVILQTDDLTTPVDPFGAEIPFQVALGESPASVSKRLREQGLIHNPGAFRNYLVYSGLDTRIQAGDYTISPAMSPIEIAQALQDATPSEVDFSILAGWRLEEIAASLPTSGLAITPEEFVAEAQQNDAEGLLLPGVYTISRDISAELLVLTLVNAFDAAATPEMQSGFAQQGLSTREAAILASIVKRESVIDAEMPMIASVFLNRLAIGMNLDADPTVQYALGYNQSQGMWWTNPLTGADLEVDSAYNTYLYPGLPPGPICNPGVTALRAVAFPAQSPYYYFRAACDGSGQHVFAETFEEHVGNACP